MDHKIIKTELKFVFYVVELPKNIKKSNFCKIRILRIRFTQKVKNPSKKALLADFHFFNCHFWQSDIWISDHSSEIPHRTGSNGVSFDGAHVGAHQSPLCQKAHVPVKKNLFSKFKFVIFGGFSTLTSPGHLTFDLETMFPESGHGYTQTGKISVL